MTDIKWLLWTLTKCASYPELLLKNEVLFSDVVVKLKSLVQMCTLRPICTVLMQSTSAIRTMLWQLHIIIRAILNDWWYLNISIVNSKIQVWNQQLANSTTRGIARTNISLLLKTRLNYCLPPCSTSTTLHKIGDHIIINTHQRKDNIYHRICWDLTIKLYYISEYTELNMMTKIVHFMH